MALGAGRAGGRTCKNFSLGLVRELKPRAMTRDIDWGVPVPVDGYPRRRSGSTSGSTPSSATSRRASSGRANRGTPDAWREWWQNPDAGHFYFMGKDNIVFHSVIWPAMLLGYGEGGELGAGRGDLHLPTNVVASEYLTMEGKKASTSRNVAIWVADFLERYDPDAAPLLPRPRAARRRRTPTSRGTSSSGARTTSCSRTGATSSTGRS